MLGATYETWVKSLLGNKIAIKKPLGVTIVAAFLRELPEAHRAAVVRSTEPKGERDRGATASGAANFAACAPARPNKKRKKKKNCIVSKMVVYLMRNFAVLIFRLLNTTFMDKKTERIAGIAILLMLSLGNYNRLDHGDGQMRAVQWVQVAVIVALTILLIYQLVRKDKI